MWLLIIKFQFPLSRRERTGYGWMPRAHPLWFVRRESVPADTVPSLRLNAQVFNNVWDYTSLRGSLIFTCLMSCQNCEARETAREASTWNFWGRFLSFLVDASTGFLNVIHPLFFREGLMEEGEGWSFSALISVWQSRAAVGEGWC